MIPINFKPMGDARLPARYRAVKRLHAEGGAYIDTGIFCGGELVVSVVFWALTGNNWGQTVWGQRANGQTHNHLTVGWSYGDRASLYFDSRLREVTISGEMVWVVDGVAREMRVNGKTYPLGEVVETLDKGSAYLFAGHFYGGVTGFLNVEGSYIASFSVADKQGILLADYQPVVDVEEKTYGMYDHVSAQFKANNNSAGRFLLV